MISHILNAVLKSEKHESKLSNLVYSIQGMSGKKGRCLLNNICDFDGVNYLEVGSWMGSTLISSSYKNKGRFTAIDNFEQFGGPKNELLTNINNFSSDCNIKFIESDCWLVDKNQIPDNINVYFFDGAHDYLSQKRALLHFIDKMDNKFILIVDDWNDKSEEVQNGTRDGIKELNLKTSFSIEIGQGVDSDSNGYWNGFGIFILEK